MSDAVMQPVRASVRIELPPKGAFRLFTEGMGTWWPMATHSIAADTYENKVRAEAVVFEGRAGGRIFERMSDGREADWGAVIVWDPPQRVVFTWKPNFDAVPPTEVEVRFAADGAGTIVDLEHRGWERLGEAGEQKRRGYETGWPRVISRYAEAATRP
jgi:uncharacterized protein YndB with AHSA1/START domain